MQISKKNTIRVVDLLLVVSALFVSEDCFSASSTTTSRMKMRVGNWDMAFHCDSELGSRVAGGREQITITVYDWNTRIFPNLEQGIPDVIEIVAGRLDESRNLPDDQRFIVDKYLTEEMKIVRLVGETDHQLDSVAFAEGNSSPTELRGRLVYCFGLSIPYERVGSRIYLLATFETQQTGRMAYVTAIDDILPCDPVAEQIASGSLLSEAFFVGNHEYAVILADSLVTEGFTDPIGLGWALKSALALGRWPEALRIMDANYEANGRISVFSFGSDEVTSEKQSREYFERRQFVVQKIAEQQK